MATAVYLPKIGMTMEEGTLTRWHVTDGASVKQGDPLFELETEKITMDVEAEREGILRQLVPEDTTLKPGDIVGALLAAGEELPASMRRGTPPAAPLTSGARSAPAGPPPSGGPERMLATPIARRLALENSMELSALIGSGPGGRIVEADVKAAIEAKSSAPPSTFTTSMSSVARSEAEARPSAQATSASVPYRGRRRTIGERMMASLSEMAQLTLVSEAPVDEAIAMLHGLNREWRRDGVVVTLTALVVKAAALALVEHPRFNSRLEGESIVTPSHVNIGVAVDLDEGLVAPVITDAASLSLHDVARRVRQITEVARDSKLHVDDLTGGTFTVTSLEGTGVDAFTPVINPPQAAILGVGRVRDIAAFEGATVVRRQVTTLSLTFDHRVADGAPAARFLDRIAELLGRPYLLM